MKVAVFGAAGWVGRAVLEAFSGHHTVRVFETSPKAWETYSIWDGPCQEDDVVYGNIADYTAVNKALDGTDAVVHTAVHAGAYDASDDQPFLINLKGLWNVLEVARQRGIQRVVHLGSCQVIHPHGVFFSADVRRPDGSLYAITKRLQEEMCRQFHEAWNLSIIVLRPCSIVDSRLGIGKRGESLRCRSPLVKTGWVCRHDLAEACRRAVETDRIDFDILHTVGGTTAEKNCNVGRTRQVLSMEFAADLEQYVVDEDT